MMNFITALTLLAISIVVYAGPQQDLEKAVVNGDQVMAREAIIAGANLDQVGINGTTPFQLALIKGNTAIIRMLLLSHSTNVKPFEGITHARLDLFLDLKDTLNFVNEVENELRLDPASGGCETRIGGDLINSIKSPPTLHVGNIELDRKLSNNSNDAFIIKFNNLAAIDSSFDQFISKNRFKGFSAEIGLKKLILKASVNNLLQDFARTIAEKLDYKITDYVILELLKNAYDSNLVESFKLHEKNLRPIHVKIIKNETSGEIVGLEVRDEGTGFSQFKDTKQHTFGDLGLTSSTHTRSVQKTADFKSEVSLGDFTIMGGKGVGLEQLVDEVVDTGGTVAFWNSQEGGASVLLNFVKKPTKPPKPPKPPKPLKNPSPLRNS